MEKILLYISTLFILIGCTDDLSNEQWEKGNEEKVVLTFNVNIPDVYSVSSRGTFNIPTVETLHLIVFDNNGYFVEKKQATKTKTIVSDIEHTQFSVELTASATQRTIHFIGNYDGADNLPFGSESDIIGGLKNSDDTDAYWQRMTFGSISDETSIDTVHLIRNYAKVSVKESLDNFVLERFTVVNIVNEGFVAPYNQNNNSFAQFLNANNTPLAYSALTSGTNAYTGYTPQVEVDKVIDDEMSWIAPGGNFYLYERSFEEENHTFVIVKGKYGDNDPSYYKVDIVNANKDYYHILRNFSYNITITEVTGNGKSSAQDAYDMKGSHNNLTASVELQSLSNISDGNSQLYVSYTEEYIVSSSPITLKYKYIPDIDNKSTTSNSSATIEYTQNGDVIKSLVNGTTDDSEGWRTITITPQDISNVTKKQTLTIKAGNLQRTVTYILCKPYVMEMQCYDGNEKDKTDKLVDANVNEKVNIDITLPTGLPESLFPLTFYIEAEKRTLYPDAEKNQIPVETEIPSIFNGVATFGYTKEITWEMYYDATNKRYNTEYTCKFLTNTAANASRVRISNRYFSVAEDYFTNSGTTYYTLPVVVSNNGTNLPTSDNTIITIFYTDGTIMGNTTWGELKAGTAAVLTTVDTTDQNSSFGYFAYTKDGKTYKTGNMNIEQLDNTLNFN